VLVKDVVQGVAEARRTTTEAIIQTVQANFLELIRDDRRFSNTCVVLEKWQSGC
jgi:hypothetical protein